MYLSGYSFCKNGKFFKIFERIMNIYINMMFVFKILTP